MGEIFLDKALGLLSSDKQKDRADGLAGPCGYCFTQMTVAERVPRSQTCLATEQAEFQIVSLSLRAHEVHTMS